MRQVVTLRLRRGRVFIIYWLLDGYFWTDTGMVVRRFKIPKIKLLEQMHASTL